MIRGLAAAVGKGLFAGAAGTAAMTVSSIVEMKLRGRPPSTTPAKAVETVLEREPRSEQAEQRFSNLVHWGYGTAWGAFRGLVGFAGLHGPPAAVAHPSPSGEPRSLCSLRSGSHRHLRSGGPPSSAWTRSIISCTRP